MIHEEKKANENRENRDDSQKPTEKPVFKYIFEFLRGSH